MTSRRDRPSRPARCFPILPALAITLGLADASRAQLAHRPTPFVEIHAGVQDPDSDRDVVLVSEGNPPDPAVIVRRPLDRPDLVVGARGGVAWKRLSASGLVTRYATQRGKGRLERTSMVAEAGWIAVDGRRLELVVNGGVGAVRVRATDAQEWESRTIAMIQAGVGLRLDLGGRLYLRPELRLHAYSGSADLPDWEATLGLGIRLGRRDPSLMAPSR